MGFWKDLLSQPIGIVIIKETIEDDEPRKLVERPRKLIKEEEVKLLK